MNAMPVRWIRLGPVAGEHFEAAYTALARRQNADAPAVVLWAEAESDLRIAQGSAAASAIWVEKGEHAVAVVAHRSRAPGRIQRWPGWALAAVVASYRRFGLPAYWDEEAGGPGLVWLRGAPVAHGAACEVGPSAVIVAGLDLRALPGLPLRVSTPGALSGGRWRPLRAVCSRDFEGALLQGLQAQHGWAFEHSWLSEEERRAIAELRLSAAA
jgi:hypothetical protein